MKNFVGFHNESSDTTPEENAPREFSLDKNTDTIIGVDQEIDKRIEKLKKSLSGLLEAKDIIDRYLRSEHVKSFDNLHEARLIDFKNHRIELSEDMSRFLELIVHHKSTEGTALIDDMTPLSDIPEKITERININVAVLKDLENLKENN